MESYVFYDDTDCAGIMYHGNYIRLCERARSYEFFIRGLLPTSKDNKHAFVANTLNCKFLATSTLGDKLKVQNSILELKKTSLVLKQEVYKVGELLSVLEPSLCFYQEVKLAYISLESKSPAKISPDILDLIKEIFSYQ